MQASLFAAAPTSRLPISSEEWLLVDRAGNRHVLASGVMDALDRLGEFRSLDEHRQTLFGVFPELKHRSDQVDRVLENLVQRRLLLDAKRSFESLTQNRSASPLPLRVVLFARGRNLEKLSQALALHADWRDAIVVSDGAEQSQLTSLAAALAPRQVAILGRAELLGSAPETLRPLFASDLNLALWLARGHRLLWLDDLAHLPVRWHSQWQPTAAALPAVQWTENALRDVQFASDHRAALDTGHGDSLSLHLALCGAGLGTMPETLGGWSEQTLYGLAPTALVGHDGARVRATVSGTRGSADGAHSLWLYGLHDRLPTWAANADRYRSTVEAQSIEHVCAQTRVMRTGAWRPLVIDTSLARGCSVGGNLHADRCFHALSQFLSPDTVVVHLPDAVGRSAGLSRTRHDVNKEPLPPTMNGFLADHALGLSEHVASKSVSARTTRLADSLRDLAEASESHRNSVLWDYLSVQQGRVLHALQSTLETSDAMPEFWRKDVSEIAHQYGTSLMQARTARLHECPAHLDQTGACEHFSSSLRTAADQLLAWSSEHSSSVDHG